MSLIEDVDNKIGDLREGMKEHRKMADSTILYNDAPWDVLNADNWIALADRDERTIELLRRVKKLLKGIEKMTDAHE